MQKKTITLFAMLTIGLLALSGFAIAHGSFEQRAILNNDKQDFHEQMELIIEDGTYEDFDNFREESGFNMMAWVVDGESFEVMQEHHELMEEYHEQNSEGSSMMQGFGRNRGFGGCPMH
ncbi:hypothetical protein GOV04_04290 [Candidatus Woesearchaeota archaeon]|nr:hypothetical protein [Candidatus Woesearchaeota archaeon]